MKAIAKGKNLPEDKVRKVSSSKVNKRIDQETEENIEKYRNSNNDAIRERVKELDREWDMDRVLELNAGLLSLAGVSLSLTMSRKWMWLPGIVAGFLAMHAVQGWCPPVPVFRRMGIRTRKEIDREKYALLQLNDRQR